LKGAARFLACDGQDSKAIVVTADIAEYRRGSTGEPTQGAGAVAILLEPEAKMLVMDLNKGGVSANYRGPDFRKPFVRFAKQKASTNAQVRDFPVFNGFYSTNCYIDAILVALSNMFNKRGLDRSEYLRNTAAIFMHRPYTRMPETGLAMSYLFSLAMGKSEDHSELKSYCEAARVKFHDVLEELSGKRNFRECVEEGRLNTPMFSRSMRVTRVLRRFDSFRRIERKMALGWEIMKNVGNLYSASLPAWLAAGLEDAFQKGVELQGYEILTLGYGSGDAAEAIPMRAVEGWQKEAEKIKFEECFAGAIDLNEAQYVSLHSGRQPVDLPIQTAGEFFISRVGKENNPDFEEEGIEYYAFDSSKRSASGVADNASSEMKSSADMNDSSSSEFKKY